jgi:hypothetical protein
MKKLIALILGIVLLLAFGFIWFVNGNKQDFKNNVDYLADRKWRMVYNAPFVEYYYEHFSAPLSFEEVQDYRITLMHGNELKSEFMDPFSKDNDLLYYLPLFDTNYSNVIGFAVVSSGIDGKRDFQSNSPLIIEDLYNQDAFYNTITNMPGVYQGDFTDTVFSLNDYLFGKKDLLIELIDCREFYQNSYRYQFSISELFNLMRVGTIERYTKQNLLIDIKECDAEEYFVKKNRLTIAYQQNRVEFKFISEDELKLIDSNSRIVGQIDTIDFNVHTCILKNCMIISPGNSLQMNH